MVAFCLWYERAAAPWTLQASQSTRFNSSGSMRAPQCGQVVASDARIFSRLILLRGISHSILGSYAWILFVNRSQGIAPTEKEFFLWEGTPLPFPFQRMLWDSDENAHTNFSILEAQQARVWMASLAKK